MNAGRTGEADQGQPDQDAERRAGQTGRERGQVEQGQEGARGDHQEDAGGPRRRGGQGQPPQQTQTEARSVHRRGSTLFDPLGILTFL